METLILLYGIPAGQTERYTEALLATSCKSQAEVDRIIAMASKDGFHSFRAAKHVDGTLPNFANAINRG